jgi:putative ABC transport system substrate-binding protein
MEAPVGGRRTHRIGVLAFGTFADRLDSLREGLQSVGYVEGRDFVLESCEGKGRQVRLAGLARELVSLEVDVIVGNSTPVIEALKAATSTIPIVMAPGGDALASRLVTSLARPGGNVTGLSLALVAMAGKTMSGGRATDHAAGLSRPRGRPAASSISHFCPKRKRLQRG